MHYKYQLSVAETFITWKNTQETWKRKECNDRVMNIEHGTFTPLVCSVNGVMSKECSMFHKYTLHKKLPIKQTNAYEKT